MRSSVVVVALFCLARPALADEAKERIAAAKAMLAAQTKALTKNDQKAFDATFTTDAKTWIGGNWSDVDEDFNLTLVTPRKIKIASSQIGWAGTWGWLAAELQVTWKMYAEPEGAGDPNPKPRTDTMHWFAVFVPDGKGVKTRVVMVQATAADKDLTDFNFVQELVPMQSPSVELAVLAQPATLVKKLSKDRATTVFGSSPRDRGVGAAAAKKLVGGWSKLTLEVADSAKADEKNRYKPVEISVGDGKVVWGRVRMKFAGKKRWILLDALAITRKVGEDFEIVALGYGP